MKKIQTTLLLLAGMAILTMAILSEVSIQSVQAAAGDPIVIIVNSTNLVDNLSKAELKRLFLSDRTKWDTGKAVAPVMVSAGAPERRAFLKLVCGMNDADFSKYFLQAAFTGKSATPPREVSNAQSVKGLVASSPGAIGFVRAGDFHGDGSDGGVRAVKVDGIAAGDANYKLKM